MKSKIVSLIFFLITSLFTFGQVRIPGTEYTLFELKNKKENINFIIPDTNFNQVKPILLYLQGSQPVPLFMDFYEQGIWAAALSNFDVERMKLDYHVVIISNPHTPVVVGINNLNKQYNYITDSSRQYSYSVDYLKADYSENYVNRANQVLKFLSKQKWVDNSELIVFGHSQGSRVAVKLAVSNSKITRLGLSSYNPNGRIHQAIQGIRRDAERGKISWAEADSLQNEQLEFYKEIQNKDSIKANPSLTSWASFSQNTIEDLLKIKIPIYISYGSDDDVADCDLIPLRFIDLGKDNLTIKRYPNVEHNYFPVNKKGEVDYNNGLWKEVMNTFLEWTKTLNNN